MKTKLPAIILTIAIVAAIMVWFWPKSSWILAERTETEERYIDLTAEEISKFPSLLNVLKEADNAWAPKTVLSSVVETEASEGSKLAEFLTRKYTKEFGIPRESGKALPYRIRTGDKYYALDIVFEEPFLL